MSLCLRLNTNYWKFNGYLLDTNESVLLAWAGLLFTANIILYKFDSANRRLINNGTVWKQSKIVLRK